MSTTHHNYKVDVYNRQKLIIETPSGIDTYTDIEKIEEIKKQTQFGLIYNEVSDEVIDACDEIIYYAYA